MQRARYQEQRRADRWDNDNLNSDILQQPLLDTGKHRKNLEKSRVLKRRNRVKRNRKNQQKTVQLVTN